MAKTTEEMAVDDPIFEETKKKVQEKSAAANSKDEPVWDAKPSKLVKRKSFKGVNQMSRCREFPQLC